MSYKSKYESPFWRNAKDQYQKDKLGGKVDDITVLVAEVQV